MRQNKAKERSCETKRSNERSCKDQRERNEAVRQIRRRSLQSEIRFRVEVQSDFLTVPGEGATKPLNEKREEREE